jgi:phosphatidylinositol glycan class B
VGFLHPDEQYYTLDFAFSSLGLLDNLSTWELDAKIRPWTLPYVITILLYPFKALGITNPFTLATIARLSSGLLGFYTLVSFTTYLKRFFTNESFEYFKKFSLFFYPLIFMSVRTSSDNWATCFFILGMLQILKDENISSKSLIHSGLLLGLSFSLRHQTGFLSLFFGLWLLFVQKVSIKDWFLKFSSMIALGVFIGIGLDTIGYGEFTLTPINYLKENLIKDKISSFGVMPWWGYFKLSLKSLHIYSAGLILAFFIFTAKNKNSFATWTIVPFLIFHSMIGHKELRFIYPALFFTIFMFFKTINVSKYKKVLNTFFYINIVGVLIVSFKPAYTPMKFYNYLYNFKPNKEIKLYTFKDRKGRVPTLEMNVYKRVNTTLTQSTEILEENFYAFTTKYSDLEMINSKYKCYQEYISYPAWVLKFNPFKWRDRSNIWALSSCTK